LRELIIIEAVYAGIVETILPHLDFFIVNTVKQAKEILDYLNKKKLGRMTILIR
jgi:chromosome segregation ATPase